MNGGGAKNEVGKQALDRFCEAVPAACKNVGASRNGDAYLTIDGVKSYVEVKGLGAGRVNPSVGTINQVRADLYLPIVAVELMDPPAFWIVPPKAVLAYVLDKDGRGQHGGLPSENTNFDIKARQWDPYKCAATDVARTVEAACRDAAAGTDIMDKLAQWRMERNAATSELDERYRRELKAAITPKPLE